MYKTININSGKADLRFASGPADELINLTDKVTFSNSGNIGIGTINPSELLHVSSTSDAGVLIEADIDNSGENDNPKLQLSQDGGAIKAMIALEGNSGHHALGTNSNALLLAHTNALDDIQFITNGQAQLTLMSITGVGYGRLGLHTNNPSSDFEIVQSSDSTGDSFGGITFTESDDDNDNWRIYNSGVNFSFNRNGPRVSYITPAGLYTVNSDRRLKKDITTLKNILPKVLKLNPVKYRYKRQANTDKPTIGFIAQEVLKLFPELVNESEEYLGMSYSNTGIIAIKAIQEQQVTIQKLQKQIDQLHDIVNQLTETINKK